MTVMRLHARYIVIIFGHFRLELGSEPIWQFNCFDILTEQFSFIGCEGVLSLRLRAIPVLFVSVLDEAKSVTLLGGHLSPNSYFIDHILP